MSPTFKRRPDGSCLFPVRPPGGTSHCPAATGHGGLWLRLALSVLLAAFGAGCRVVQTAVDVPDHAIRAVTPGKPGKDTVGPVEVQPTLLRFADEFSTRLILGVEMLRRGPNALDPADVLKWKIALATATTAIASGPNARANLLDMTVFVSVTRTALEEHWQPKVFGASAQSLVESCRQAETNIWRLVGLVLNPAQQAELRQAIEMWYRQNPQPENVLAARAVGFASRVAQATPADTAKPGSVFSLLQLDPLSGLDPATREIAQTRLFAERALFVTQKLPLLLRWQTELLSLNTVGLPAVQQLVANTTQIAASVDRFAHAAEQLPGQVSAEREEIFKALQAQEKNLIPLVSEVRQTLTAGSQMSTSLNTTLTTFDALMQRFGLGEANQTEPPNTNAEPFRIQDYGQTAAQLEAAARQLTELLVTLDRTIGSTNLAQFSAQVGSVAQQAQTSGKELVNDAFWKGILLVAIVLVAALSYRWLGRHLIPVTPTKTNSP